MVSVPDNERDPATQPESAAGARVAHELANLLDGSLRNVALAISQLYEHDQQHAIEKLEDADAGLRSMATLIKRWMADQHAPSAELHHDTRTLAVMVQHAARLFGPAVHERGAELLVSVQPTVKDLPAGPVYPVIVNAMRNGVEAIDAALAKNPNPDLPHRIELWVSSDGEDVVITVVDSGIGLDKALFNADGKFSFGRTTKAQGHGLGLKLSDDIARQLDGEVTLSNHGQRGARFEFRYPKACVETVEQP